MHIQKQKEKTLKKKTIQKRCIYCFPSSDQFPYQLSTSQKRQGNETLIPARFSLQLGTKGIKITLSRLSILFMDFYFKLSLLL